MQALNIKYTVHYAKNVYTCILMNQTNEKAT